jgi:hypothetical protein
MNVTVSRLNMKTTRANWPAEMPFTPALIHAKQPGQPENWFVIDAKVDTVSPPSFAGTTNDQYLRIPLFEYTLSPKADLALAAMVQIGLACVGHIQKPVRTLHVVTGDPVDLLYGDDINTAIGLRYWFGFAIATER